MLAGSGAPQANVPTMVAIMSTIDELVARLGNYASETHKAADRLGADPAPAGPPIANPPPQNTADHLTRLARVRDELHRVVQSMESACGRFVGAI